MFQPTSNNCPRVTRVNRFYLLLVALSAGLSVWAGPARLTVAADAPQLNDDRYTISLFADVPDVRTPIGAAVDAHGRLFVVESHTLSPPPEYEGPKTDRIKVFADDDHDGKPDQITVFADGLKSAMKLLFVGDGGVYVTCSRSVLRLEDFDGDGRADQRTTIVELETQDTFPFGYLTSTVSAPDGWLYISFGEFPYPWKLSGSDGSAIEGWGGGDGIFRCKPDGSQLQKVATGFWAPFSMTLDNDGRLLLLDNDPFSRAPNRLLHIVPGGDYGHRWLYGFAGNHPLNGWSGDLPGTLAPVAEVGEAPAGMMVCAKGRFPSDFASSLLVSAWGGNAIERHELEWRNTRAEAKRTTWIQGDTQFHPIALAQDSNGTLYLTDWVVNDFHSHGNGRIWRVSPKKNVKLVEPQRTVRMWELPQVRTRLAIEDTLRSDDPVLRHAGSLALARPSFATLAQELAKDADPRLRLGALVAIRHAGREHAHRYFKKFLRDDDESVRHAAVVWIGQERLAELRGHLEQALDVAVPSRRLLSAWLGTSSVLTPSFVEQCQTRSFAAFEALPTSLPNAVTHPLLRRSTWPAELRMTVMPWLEDPTQEETSLLLLELASNDEAPLNVAALRQLSSSELSSVDSRLVEIAFDRQRSVELRCEAVATLARRDAAGTNLMQLLKENDESLSLEVVQAMSQLAHRQEGKKALRKVAATETDGVSSRVREEANFILRRKAPEQSTDLANLQKRLLDGGNPARGERLFFSPRATCGTCHTIHGFGGQVGPDLSEVGRSLRRSEIIHSIVRPSDYFAPEFQIYALETKNGQVHSGIVLSADNVSTTLQTADGSKVTIPSDDIDSLLPLRKSIMPDGLEATVSAEGLRDLISFLVTLR